MGKSGDLQYVCTVCRYNMAGYWIYVRSVVQNRGHSSRPMSVQPAIG
jgi:hypothetical protein